MPQIQHLTDGCAIEAASGTTLPVPGSAWEKACGAARCGRVLKRADEKYVTEAAYDNPKFVEDLVRDAALALNREPRVRAYVVEAENLESIHNHSAFARVVRAMDYNATGAWPAPRQQDLRQLPKGGTA